MRIVSGSIPYLISYKIVRCFLLDHHLNWIDPEAQLFALGYGVRDSATAVGHLCVKVHPVAGLRLCHQEDVHLEEEGRAKGERESAHAVAHYTEAPHLFSRQGDHVQGPVHEAANQGLRTILGRDGVVHSVVGGDILQ